MTMHRSVYALIVSMLLVNLVIAGQFRRQVREGYSDFISFYSAAKILQRGEAHRLYDLRLQFETQQEFSVNVRTRGGPLPFVRPAYDAWLYRPFAFFPYETAFLLWDLASCACLLGTAIMLRNSLPGLRRFSLPTVFFGFLSFFPVFLTLIQGQDSIVLLLVFTVAWRALQKGRDFGAGAVLAFGLFKFPLVIPLALLLVLRKGPRVGLGFVASAAVLLGISVATVGTQGVSAYPEYLRNVNALSTGINIPRDMPNLRGLLSGIVHGAATLKWSVAIVSGVFFLYAWHLLQQTKKSPAATLPVEVALAVTMTLLVSYHSHVFDLTLLLLAASLLVGWLWSDTGLEIRLQKLLVWCIAAALFSPIYIFVTLGIRQANALALLLLLLFFATAKTLLKTARRGMPQAASCRAT